MLFNAIIAIILILGAIALLTFWSMFLFYICEAFCDAIEKKDEVDKKTNNNPPAGWDNWPW